MKVLVVGDIVGNTGRTVIKKLLPQISREHNLDMIIANGENAAGGIGITKEIAEELFNNNIDVITMGNHTWDKKEILSYIGSQPNLIRPANYPLGTPGKGYTVFNLKNNIKVGVVNISGVVFLPPLIPPFLIIDKVIAELKKECQIIIVDFHAEATSEKIAMGWYLDGKVSAVVGTHTHVQTADERILPGGTAYITDIGMTGPRDSVLGIKKEIAINKFLTQMPVKFETADGLGQLNGVILTIDSATGLAISITRIQEFI
ncbi:MAG: TIGR00282 family metallophosphoesterase [Clostridia bacterium]|nr:TIGR00282 family metallophosphoesterase [Clostridia bacterium]